MEVRNPVLLAAQRVLSCGCLGLVVTMNVNDKHFNPLVKPFIEKTIVLADYGFRDKDGVPENMKICRKGTWNERMCVETALSLITVICDLKRIRHRLAVYI